MDLVSNSGGGDSRRFMMQGRRKILCAAILGVLPLVGGCANTAVKETAELGKWGRAAEHPVVLSSNSAHDTAVYNASEDQLSEADWKILEQLGPKAIWERIAGMNKAARERRTVSGASTQPSLGSGKAATRPTLTIADLEKDTPVIQMPDGKIRMIYALRNYGGQTVTTALTNEECLNELKCFLLYAFANGRRGTPH